MLDAITIRPRRQITLPKKALKAIDLQVGEKLAIDVKKDSIILQPLEDGVINTLSALQRALRKATTLSSLQKQAKKVRKELWQKKIKK